MEGLGWGILAQPELCQQPLRQFLGQSSQLSSRRDRGRRVEVKGFGGIQGQVVRCLPLAPLSDGYSRRSNCPATPWLVREIDPRPMSELAPCLGSGYLKNIQGDQNRHCYWGFGLNFGQEPQLPWSGNPDLTPGDFPIPPREPKRVDSCKSCAN